jgi:hypothetical protein
MSGEMDPLDVLIHRHLLDLTRQITVSGLTLAEADALVRRATSISARALVVENLARDARERLQGDLDPAWIAELTKRLEAVR